MPIEVVRLALGPLDNNTYLLADSDQKVAVVVDPSFGSQAVLDEVAMRGWSLRQIWLTHAHFDHLAGIYEIEAAYQPALLVGLHPADLPLWENRGDADQFGLTLDPGPRPTLWFEHGQHLSLGNEVIEVRHAPATHRGTWPFTMPVAFFGWVILFLKILSAVPIWLAAILMSCWHPSEARYLASQMRPAFCPGMDQKPTWALNAQGTHLCHKKNERLNFTSRFLSIHMSAIWRIQRNAFRG